MAASQDHKHTLYFPPFAPRPFQTHFASIMAVVWSVNPSTNAGKTERREYLGTATQSASGHPYVDYVANLASNQESILPQGTHLVGGGFWTFEIPLVIDDALINGEASSLVQLSSGICPLYHW